MAKKLKLKIKGVNTVIDVLKKHHFETNTKDKNAPKRHDLSKPAFDFKTLFDQ